MTSLLSTERHDQVLALTMDDGKANALSSALIGELTDALTSASADDSVRAVVLAGRPGKFSAGFDLSVMQGGDMAAMVNLVADGGALVRLVYGLEIPVVAASTGHALAAGALLLLGCDVRVGAEGPFKIGLNEVAIGMTLPEWAHTIARERISNRHLQRCIANARITGPTDALDTGFLDRVVAPDDLMAAAVAEATELTGLDAGAYRRTMRGFRGETLAKMDAEIAADRASVAG